jgi:hypothetical protein
VLANDAQRGTIAAVLFVASAGVTARQVLLRERERHAREAARPEPSS